MSLAPALSVLVRWCALGLSSGLSLGCLALVCLALGNLGVLALQTNVMLVGPLYVYTIDAILCDTVL